MIKWIRIPSKGFLPAELIGVATNGQTFIIYRRVIAHGRNRKVTAILRERDYCGEFRNEAEAKAAAETMVEAK